MAQVEYGLNIAWDDFINIDSGNVLWPDSTKPLPEPMLAHHD